MYACVRLVNSSVSHCSFDIFQRFHGALKTYWAEQSDCVFVALIVFAYDDDSIWVHGLHACACLCLNLAQLLFQLRICTSVFVALALEFASASVNSLGLEFQHKIIVLWYFLCFTTTMCVWHHSCSIWISLLSLGLIEHVIITLGGFVIPAK